MRWPSLAASTPSAMARCVLPTPGGPRKTHVAAFVQEAPGGQLVDQALVDRGLLVEVESVETPLVRQVAILPTLKFATQRNYRHLVRRHLLPIFGNFPLCNIRRQQIQGFVTDKMTKQQFSWKTSFHLRNLLSKIFSTAVDWEYLQANPASGVKLPQRPLREPSRFLTRSEVSCLLSALDEPERTLVLMAVLTGMRIGELLALRWKNVDFDRRTVRVREAVYEGHNSTPKTQGGIRDIPFGPTLEQALRRHAGSRIPDDSLVFPSRNGTHLRPGNLLKRCLYPACAKAQLRRFSWHDFRRTRATLLSDMGEPLKTAQAQLGHASLSTTAEIYAQAVPESQRAAVERLERAVGSFVDPNSGGVSYPAVR